MGLASIPGPLANTPAPISLGFSWHIAAPPLPRFTAQEICHAAVGLNASTDWTARLVPSSGFFHHAKTLTLTFMLSGSNMNPTSTLSVSPRVSPQYPVEFTSQIFGQHSKSGLSSALHGSTDVSQLYFPFSGLSYGNNW
jgi:hypothetical protein